MVVQLTEREQSEVSRGTALTGTVTGSNVECVVLRADLFERVRFLFDQDPDAAIHEMAGLIADFSPEDWKSPEEWREIPIMTDSSRYVKIVEWSDEDHCFVGHCPGVIGPCCHGDDEVEVYRELCQIVEEWLDLAQQDNRPLPPPTSGKALASQLVGSRG